MSFANPNCAVDALLSRTIEFAGKEVALTCGALLAVEATRHIENERIVAWTLLFVASQENVPLALMRSESGILPAVLEWAEALGAQKREEAILVARRLIAQYKASACRYEIIGKQGKEVECGNVVAMAGFFMREYGMKFEEYCELPATRANALYAAWCESMGMDGVETYRRKEQARNIAQIMESLNFGEAE